MVDRGHALVNGGIIRVASGASVPLTNLIAYYKFEGAAGVKGTDSSGNGLTLTDHGTVADVAGVLGQGASFDGSSKWLTHVDDTNFSMGTSQEFTLHGWVNIQGSYPGSDPFLLGKCTDMASFPNIEYTIRWTGTKIGFQVCDGSAATNNSAGSVSGAGWHFFYLKVYAGPTIRFAVDMGVEVGGTGRWAQDAGNAFAIGEFPGGAASVAFYADSIGLWKRALSAGELTALYNAGAGFDPV